MSDRIPTPAPTVARERIAHHLGLSPQATDQAIIAAARQRYPDLGPEMLAARLGHVAYPPARWDRDAVVVPIMLTALVLIVFVTTTALLGVPLAVVATTVGLVWAGCVARPRRRPQAPTRSSSTAVVRR